MTNTSATDYENIGALRQRVLSIETNQKVLVDSVHGLGNRVETLFATLSAKIEDRSRPQYTLMISLGAVGLAFMTAIGGLAYAPVREGQSDLKSAIIETNKTVVLLADKMPRDFASVREVDQRTTRLHADIGRVSQEITALTSVTVPRVEQAERHRSIETQMTNLQRQLDDIKKSFGETYSLRDALQEMRRELDRIREKRVS